MPRALVDLSQGRGKGQEGGGGYIWRRHEGTGEMSDVLSGRRKAGEKGKGLGCFLLPSLLRRHTPRVHAHRPSMRQGSACRCKDGKFIRICHTAEWTRSHPFSFILRHVIENKIIHICKSASPNAFATGKADFALDHICSERASSPA